MAWADSHASYVARLASEAAGSLRSPTRSPARLNKAAMTQLSRGVPGLRLPLSPWPGEFDMCDTTELVLRLFLEVTVTVTKCRLFDRDKGTVQTKVYSRWSCPGLTWLLRYCGCIPPMLCPAYCAALRGGRPLGMWVHTEIVQTRAQSTLVQRHFDREETMVAGFSSQALV